FLTPHQSSLYTLSLHDALPIWLLGDVAIMLDRGRVVQQGAPEDVFRHPASPYIAEFLGAENVFAGTAQPIRVDARDRSTDVTSGDRKSTRLNSSHDQISYAVFC